MTRYLDHIPVGRTSITDRDDWREFCLQAAGNLSMLNDDDLLVMYVVDGIDYATRRYKRIAERLRRMFGSWKGWRVVEVGGGYGGQAKVMFDRYPFTYSSIDLPEPLVLQHAFLATYGYSISPVELPADLFISNYAISECRRREQRKYMRIAAQCERGYITWNGWTHNTYTRDELAAFIPGSEWVEELAHPHAHPLNGCLVWGM